MPIKEVAIVAMRTAIRKDKRSRQWAKVNNEDNFSLAVYGIAESAAMDVICNDLDNSKTIEWYNKQFGIPNKMRAFVLTTCREMYSVLRT